MSQGEDAVWKNVFTLFTLFTGEKAAVPLGFKINNQEPRRLLPPTPLGELPFSLCLISHKHIFSFAPKQY